MTAFVESAARWGGLYNAIITDARLIGPEVIWTAPDLGKSFC